MNTPIIERCRYHHWPKPPLSNAERIEAWRRKYMNVPIEQQVEPKPLVPRAPVR